MQKIPRELKSKINRLAHAAGVAHAEKVKAALITDALAFAKMFPGIKTCAEAFPGLKVWHP